MDRLTYYDYLCKCYKMKPDAPQSQIIQRLGDYETHYESKVMATTDKIIENIEAEQEVDFTETRSEAWIDGYREALKVCLGHVKEAAK